MNNAIICAIESAKEALAPLAGQDWVIVLYLCAVCALGVWAARRWSR